MNLIPPHCDTKDGPVVTAAIKALEENNVNLILPWAPKDAEDEIKEVFNKTLEVRKNGGVHAEVADNYFFETVVRLHRKGEGKGFTGLKPVGLDWGPVVPKADKSIESGNASEVIDLLKNTLGNKIQGMFDKAMSRKKYDINNVDEARKYVHSMLEYVLFSHHLYKFISKGGAHSDGHDEE